MGPKRLSWLGYISDCRQLQSESHLIMRLFEERREPHMDLVSGDFVYIEQWSTWVSPIIPKLLCRHTVKIFIRNITDKEMIFSPRVYCLLFHWRFRLLGPSCKLALISLFLWLKSKLIDNLKSKVNYFHCTEDWKSSEKAHCTSNSRQHIHKLCWSIFDYFVIIWCPCKMNSNISQFCV